jgi:quercetin dioxygenase-like cupin family protein
MLSRWRQTLAFPVLFLAAVSLLAQGSEAGKAKSPHTGGTNKFVVWPWADLKWEPLASEPPGSTVMIAKLWGDPAKGAFAAIEKFPPGFSAGLHEHSANVKIVVISGTWIHGEEGKPDVRLTAGSYLFQPSMQRHTTACDKASECVAFVEGSGKFDIQVVGEGKAPAKK